MPRVQREEWDLDRSRNNSMATDPVEMAETRGSPDPRLFSRDQVRSLAQTQVTGDAAVRTALYSYG